jgi:hypothetical protein
MTMPDSIVSAAWLDASVDKLAQRIVRRALLDVGIVEMPPGSNRSPRIDTYVTAVGSPPGSRWCAAAVAAWWRDAGAVVPPHNAGSCDAWHAWAVENARWRTAPEPGYAVLFGATSKAVHIGVIVRVAPLVLSIEGNTSLGALDVNAVAVALKQVSAERVLGYVAPSSP